jgi:hypothetical protein
MAEVSYTRAGTMLVTIPVPGGTLTLRETRQQVHAEPPDPVSATATLREFEFTGYLPKDLALELLRRAPDHGGKVGDATLLEWLEAL